MRGGRECAVGGRVKERSIQWEGGDAAFPGDSIGRAGRRQAGRRLSSDGERGGGEVVGTWPLGGLWSMQVGV